MSDLYSLRTRDDLTIQEAPPVAEPVTSGYTGRFDAAPQATELEMTVETDADGNVTVRGKQVVSELTFETDADGNVTVKRANG